MWKKIAIFQLVLLIALVAFWAGTETTEAQPLSRQFTTQNEDGNVVYIWSYNSGNKTWNVARLDYEKASSSDVNISVR